MIAGLTGGIATGKSTVARLFQELGAHVIDFDILAHEVMRPGLKAWEEIVKFFGVEILNPDQTINRKKLGRLVFNEPEKLARLNRIVHPAVFKEDQKITAEILARDPGAVIIKEIPLLIEAGAGHLVEKIIVVYASPEVQLQRLLARGLDRDEALKRINAQAPLSEKMKWADFVIYNDGNLEETRRQVEEVYQQLVSCASVEGQ
ncbi:dephospho-CoA kinase [Desulfofundulus thermosubterraneus]|uniref:Dephospho-CoA kinase n=1 Tax=Desulfofundulus thermosubterraneus DSM 16057 TaxID=1121432 RepID=A0A1M6G3C4_9FIRM|nr:dephospho-CoA kinase [Desulfofundulus thermosubterraneus]SHJ04352.1 dephospho-CoA kinase [Desulfofundulus thermosubterraneus DSM 16057]